ncbi:hypothetical protein WJX77_003140 [Trebouxia sp. C0004]
MQSLELGQISPTESKLRRRGRRYFSTSRAYLSLYRRRFAAYNFEVWKARLQTLALLALKEQLQQIIKWSQRCLCQPRHYWRESWMMLHLER